MPTTFKNIQDRIRLDYLNRDDLIDETKRAIYASIRYYERERWPWNEAVSTLTAVASQSYISLPTDLLIFDSIQFTNSSADYALSRRNFDEIREMRVVRTTGPWPTDYAIYANRIELFPIPDSAYTLPCYYLKQLTALSADADTNKWLSAAEDVIVYHATAIMWAAPLRNPEQAQVFGQLEVTALNKLRGYRNQNYNLGLRATKF